MGYLGGIEAGGTKIVCGIGTDQGEVLERISFPTTTPEETVEQMTAYFSGKMIDSLGVASFGPIDPNPGSPTYGYITSTPKPLWGNVDLIGALKQKLHVPMVFDTDVNGAALGEIAWGAAQGLNGCLYLTVGTGIGGGAVVNGAMVHGFGHPEMGHILVKRHPTDKYKGRCPYHGDCLEGLASGPAIEERWGKKGTELGVDHPAWALQAYYLAQALMSYVLILAPERIILGGGVMKQDQLFPLVRSQLAGMLSDYIVHDNVSSRIDAYVVPPGLGDNAGLLGAIAMARTAV